MMMRCPECGSSRLVKFGRKFARNPKTGRRHLVQQYQCKRCGRITIYPRRVQGRRSVTVVVPTYQESQNIPELVRRLNPFVSPSDILIADDNSPDGTANVAIKLGCRVLSRNGNKGLSASVVDAIKIAGSDRVIVMDADLQHPPEVLPKLLEALEDNDFVVASRYVDGGGCAEWDTDRKIISRVANYATRPLTKVKDAVSGFFGFNTRGLPELGTVNTRGFKIMLELLVKGHWGSVVEVPYIFDIRRRGETKMRWQQVKDYIIQLGQLYLWKYRFFRFGMVGASGVLVNLLFLWLYTDIMGIHYLASFALAFVLAVTNNYLLNYYWTFKGRDAGQFGYFKYLFVASVTLPLDEALLYLFVGIWGIWYILGAVMAILIVFLIRYEVVKRWIWNKPAYTRG